MNLSTAIRALAFAIVLAAPATSAFAQADKLTNPAALTEQAPPTYKARFETSKGILVVEVTRALAPRGADRFYNLVKNGYYDGNRFFRVLPGFVVQFGMHGDPKIQAQWTKARIPDDPVKQTNARGTLVFATSGKNARTTQVFVNFGNNARLDGMGFAPFGRVVSGMNVVEAINAEYGETPDQHGIDAQGNVYLAQEFPRLDFIQKATIAR